MALVQAVQGALTSSFTTTTAGWVLVPGLAVTITPGSVLNRILLLGKINLASDGQNGVAYKIQRNGVDIDIGNAAGVRTRATGSAFGAQLSLDSGITLSEVFLDAPGAVVPLTYQVYVFRGNSAEVSINEPAYVDGDATNFYRTTSNLVALEIS